MPHFGWQEMLILLVIVLLIFGTKRLPEVGRSLGGAIKEFKAGTADRQIESEAVAVETKIDDTRKTPA